MLLLGGEDLLKRSRKEHSGVIHVLFILIRVLITQVDMFIKIHPIIYLKTVHFAICKFYLNLLKN